MLAVAIREPIYEAASISTSVEPDGGKVIEEEETCPYGNEMCEGPRDEIPCFPYHCDGYEPNDTSQYGFEQPE